MNSLEVINLISIIFIILFSGIVGLKRLKQNNVSCVFYGCYFVIFGVFQILSIILGTESMNSFSVDIRLKSNILNIGILLCLFLGENFILQRIKTAKKNQQVLKIKKNRSYLSILMWISLVLSICGFFIIIWSMGLPFNINVLSSYSRVQYRFAQRSSSFQMLGQWLLSLVLIANYISLVKKNKTTLILGILITLACIWLKGSRAYILYFIGPFLYYYITTKKINFKKVFLVGIFIIIFFITFENIHLWRWQTERTPQTFVKQFFDKKLYSFFLSYKGSEFSRSITNFQATALFPKEHDWLYGNTYKTIFLFWLPSGMSEGIKMDTMYTFSNVTNKTTTAYQKRASNHPTFTGDCYINFGYLFWLPAIIWGIGLAIFHIKAKKNILWNLLAGSSLVYLIALSFRGSIYQAFFQIIICAIFLLFTTFILQVPYQKQLKYST